jgi:hypothetical protein
MNKKYPSCFGILEEVFPMGDDGLRHTPEKCITCFYKTQCLRTAMKKPDGKQVREEMIDRAYASGLMGFMERWSRKKLLHDKVRGKK